jgi:hypothetical protein
MLQTVDTGLLCLAGYEISAGGKAELQALYGRLTARGETADLARRGGGRAEDLAAVFGVRLWF